MPKQSLKNPKFRCNHCKEYHSAPEHMTMYQCASHGYLCEKCVVTENSTVNLIFIEEESANRTVKFPEKYNGFCNLSGESSFKQIATDLAFCSSKRYTAGDCLEDVNLSPNSKDEELIDYWRSRQHYRTNNTFGCKRAIRYDWDNDNNLWVEEGTIPESSKNSTAKSTNLLLLIELFENDSISKEDFIKTIKSQLK